MTHSLVNADRYEAWIMRDEHAFWKQVSLSSPLRGSLLNSGAYIRPSSNKCDPPPPRPNLPIAVPSDMQACVRCWSGGKGIYSEGAEGRG